MNKQFYFRSLCVLFIFLFATSAVVDAAPPDFFGGVHNEFEYEEYVFVAGYPIKFKGTFDIRTQERNGRITHSYRMNLTSPHGKLTRNVTYVTNIVQREDKGQTISQTEVTSYNERIDILDETYTLVDYQISKAEVADNRPAADYYSGNVVGRKVYSLKSNSLERVNVHFSGKNVGYHNFWGATETQSIDFEYETPVGHGTVRSITSNSKKKYLQYQKHEPALSSFTGGHVSISEQGMVSQYQYDFPVEKGTVTLKKDMVLQIERYIVPKFRDLEGHWAKDNIEKLYSLDILEENSSFFSPDIPMTRYQFTAAIMRAADVRVLEPPTNPRQVNQRNAIFPDLDTRDPNYKYIESAVNKGIVKGVTPTEFRPNDKLTRAQAITIIIRALGLENRAPTPGYQTSYNDNHLIPYWAKDSIYVATEIGLITGDQNKRVNPNHAMTRAEASTMIIRFLSFLERDLQRDYREMIINY